MRAYGDGGGEPVAQPPEFFFGREVEIVQRDTGLGGRTALLGGALVDKLRLWKGERQASERHHATE